jgi:phosphoglycolate phosphatase-like HAD superfamily hydrolase
MRAVLEDELFEEEERLLVVDLLADLQQAAAAGAEIVGITTVAEGRGSRLQPRTHRTWTLARHV